MWERCQCYSNITSRVCDLLELQSASEAQQSASCKLLLYCRFIQLAAPLYLSVTLNTELELPSELEGARRLALVVCIGQGKIATRGIWLRLTMTGFSWPGLDQVLT